MNEREKITKIRDAAMAISEVNKNLTFESTEWYIVVNTVANLYALAASLELELVSG